MRADAPLAIRGVGVALALCLPAALLAQILDAALDDGLPGAAAAVLSLVVLAGAVVGGRFVRTRGAQRPLLAGALVGLVAIGAVATLGVIRRSVADESTAAGTIPALAALGAGLGLAGAALGAPRAARTRP